MHARLPTCLHHIAVFHVRESGNEFLIGTRFSFSKFWRQIVHYIISLGQITFTHAGHAVVLEIQATIPSTPEKPSRVPMWKGALGTYFINGICYLLVAFIGYWAFGQDVADNVLVGLQRASWLISAANLMVVVHVTGSYQVSFYVPSQLAYLCAEESL